MTMKTKMKTLRRKKTLAPRNAHRRDFDLSDATMEPEPGSPPEAVFDRVTGPYGGHRATGTLGFDEET